MPPGPNFRASGALKTMEFLKENNEFRIFSFSIAGASPEFQKAPTTAPRRLRSDSKTAPGAPRDLPRTLQVEHFCLQHAHPRLVLGCSMPNTCFSMLKTCSKPAQSMLETCSTHASAYSEQRSPLDFLIRATRVAQ